MGFRWPGGGVYSAGVRWNTIMGFEMRVPSRSVLLAVLGGMMAAAYLHSSGTLDLGFGFPRDGFAEGAIIAISGAVAGWAVLFVFRGLRGLLRRGRQ